MKRTLLDRFVGYFSPQAEARRIKAKMSLYAYERSYDAAQTFKTDDWTSVSNGSANKEISTALSTIREKSRDAIRNNPYALHAKDVIVANTIGYGIVPNIKGPSEQIVEQVRAAWKIWGETNKCDVEGLRNFYGLQATAFGAVVEGGEVLARKILVKEPTEIYTDKGIKKVAGFTRIQLLESDFIDSKKDDENTVQGIELDSYGRPSAYWLFNRHPGDGKEVTSQKFSASEVKHVFKPDRPGQRRGVSWFHAVIRLLEDLKNYQEATLIRQKIAACFAIFITPGEAEGALNAEALKAQRQADSMVEPGLVRYTNQGEKISLASPPSFDDSTYVRNQLRGAAAGVNITYEALSNDYSQSNYSSSRLGTMQMNKSVDNWRYNLIIPLFCEPAFVWFLEWCELNMGIKTAGVTATWTPPAREFIDPITEIEAIKRSVRSGIKTQDQAILEQGEDPETFYKEVQASNKKMDELGLAFDTDARKMSSVGFAQAGESFDKLTGKEPTGDKTSEENNKEDPT